jgi:hypothetical protein
VMDEPARVQANLIRNCFRKTREHLNPESLRSIQREIRLQAVSFLQMRRIVSILLQPVPGCHRDPNSKMPRAPDLLFQPSVRLPIEFQAHPNRASNTSDFCYPIKSTLRPMALNLSISRAISTTNCMS